MGEIERNDGENRYSDELNRGRKDPQRPKNSDSLRRAIWKGGDGSDEMGKKHEEEKRGASKRLERL